MTELIITHSDGRQVCRLVKDSEVYELRGDEITIEVNTVKKVKRPKVND